MRTPRSSFIALVAAVVVCAGLQPFDAPAQSYPAKPIRMVVGFATGGGADLVARMVVPKLSEELGRTVVVENRPGAAGAIGAERVVKSPADGYTLLMMSASSTILPALSKLPYDTERDLAPVSLVSIGPLVLVVHPSVPVHNVKDLISLAKSKPGVLSYGTNGAGSPPHLAGELLSSLAKMKLVHVAYKGGGDAAVATAGGQIEMSFPTVPPALSLMNAGKVRAIAVTSVKRASILAAIPTLAESGLSGYDISNWNGVSTTAGVPKDIIAKLNAAIVTVVNMPEIKETFNRQGIEPQGNTPEQFAAFIRNEIARNTNLIRLSGAKVE